MINYTLSISKFDEKNCEIKTVNLPTATLTVEWTMEVRSLPSRPNIDFLFNTFPSLFPPMTQTAL